MSDANDSSQTVSRRYDISPDTHLLRGFILNKLVKKDWDSGRV